MGLAELTDIEILQGSFTLVFCIISIILGLRIFSKYFSLKRKELIHVGLAWALLSSAWWGSGFSFLFIVLFNYKFEPILFLLLGNMFIPIAILNWMYAIGILMYQNSKNKIAAIFIIFGIFYEILLIACLLIDPSLVGMVRGTFYYQPSLIFMILQIVALLITIITGILFSTKSMKSPDLEVKWKSRFLLCGFIFFVIGAAIDAIVTLTPLLLVIVRLILIFAAILYYLGFLLPDSISKIIIKK
jgi:hypothetical protein